VLGESSLEPSVILKHKRISVCSCRNAAPNPNVRSGDCDFGQTHRNGPIQLETVWHGAWLRFHEELVRKGIKWVDFSVCLW
jgi:hypothetical protein